VDTHTLYKMYGVSYFLYIICLASKLILELSLDTAYNDIYIVTIISSFSSFGSFDEEHSK